MTQRWSILFRQFSLSVDSLDDQTFERSKQVLEQYLIERLGVSFFRAAIDGAWIKSGEFDIPALETVWSRWNKKHPTIPTREDGDLSSQLAVSFLTRKPMWVVAADEGRLIDAAHAGTGYIDQWSNIPDLPPYADFGDSMACTSILLPLEYGTRVFGVLDLQFDEVVPITDRGRLAMRRVASSFARLMWLYETERTRNADTFKAFRELEEPHLKTLSPLRRRQVFLSTSGRADERVVEILQSVLSEFEDVFDVRYWKNETLGGDIKQQVRDELMRSEFGVCYLSEPTEGEPSSPRFADNPNVIFEAGMLQALHETQRDAAVLSRWIPVREIEPFSTPLPFNFATDRVVGVCREAESGALNEEEFAESLRQAVKTQVENLGLKI
jgi:hypothetical protein